MKRILRSKKIIILLVVLVVLGFYINKIYGKKRWEKRWQSRECELIWSGEKEIDWIKMHGEIKESLGIIEDEDFYIAEDWGIYGDIPFCAYEKEYGDSNNVHRSFYEDDIWEHIFNILSSRKILVKADRDSFKIMELSFSEDSLEIINPINRKKAIKGSEKLLKKNYITGEEYFKFLSLIPREIVEKYKGNGYDMVTIKDVIITEKEWKSVYNERYSEEDRDIYIVEENGCRILKNKDEIDGKYLEAFSHNMGIVFLYKIR